MWTLEVRRSGMGPVDKLKVLLYYSLELLRRVSLREMSTMRVDFTNLYICRCS